LLSFLRLNRRKESSLEEFDLPSLSYRYAALKVRGCDPGDRVLRGRILADIYRTGSCPPFELKCFSLRMNLPRKEVIQPHLPVRLPCYDFTPLTLHTFGASPLAVGPATSGADDSGGVTGGVYKARERIHRGMLIRDY
jgi:hypothetical protein